MLCAVPDISVVICAYTMARWSDLLAAVQSVRRQSTPPREIIVVVDHNAELLQRVRRHLPSVIPVENSEPHVLSGARNSGIRVAKDEIIPFLAEHAHPQPYCLHPSLRPHT